MIELLVQKIVEKAAALKNKHTGENNAPVNYAAIFTQDTKEYENLLALGLKIGRVIQETATGPLLLVGLETVSGKLKLLKIRMPDKTRPERGDADFTVSDYSHFKNIYLGKPGFSLINKDKFEMIELADPSFDVRAYFSHPPLDEQLGLNNKG